MRDIVEVDKLNILAIIPARGGSKRLPGKNIKKLAGIPLIVHTIRHASQAKILTRTIVSTDNEAIADVCRRAGAEVPFMRPGELAEDATPDKPVLLHAMKWMEENCDFSADIVTILRPTTPLRPTGLIDKVLSLILETGCDSVRTVTSVEGVHHPYWMYTMDRDGRSKSLIEGVTLEQYYQSQLLPKVYRLNGLVDCIRADVLRHGSTIYGKDMRMFPVPAPVSFDIDTEMDFIICEKLLETGALYL